MMPSFVATMRLELIRGKPAPAQRVCEVSGVPQQQQLEPHVDVVCPIRSARHKPSTSFQALAARSWLGVRKIGHHSIRSSARLGMIGCPEY